MRRLGIILILGWVQEGDRNFQEFDLKFCAHAVRSVKKLEQVQKSMTEVANQRGLSGSQRLDQRGRTAPASPGYRPGCQGTRRDLTRRLHANVAIRRRSRVLRQRNMTARNCWTRLINPRVQG